MTDLISREALLEALQGQLDIAQSEPDCEDLEGWLTSMMGSVRSAPAALVQIVANISGGVLQGASSTHRVELYALDFDTDSFDEKATGIRVEDTMAYLIGETAKIDPDFVREVIEAPERFIHNQALVCGQCEGSGETQSASNLELEVCPVCDGTGERPDEHA